jgi:hypothetical protein
MWYLSDMTSLMKTATDLKARILARIKSIPDSVWTPADFVDIASRAAVDKTLQRLVAAGNLRRIDRGLYDRPRQNKITGRTTVPDYRAVIQAVSRRDNARVVIDGMTAANDLGLTTAVPARIEVLIDERLRPIRLGNQVIQFKTAAPSRVFWAARPAMRVVQALHWLQEYVVEGDGAAQSYRPSPQNPRGPDPWTRDPQRSADRPVRASHLDAGPRSRGDRRSTARSGSDGSQQMNEGFNKFIAAPERDRLDIFLAASRRLGTAVQNVEKDFWICWTLDVLYHGIPPGSPAPSLQRRHFAVEGSRPYPEMIVSEHVLSTKMSR